MALSATEEALVRQLLDQQAAILSLAGNEATITSKLGATKVTLSDLATASSLVDDDLMLTRQGITDKSVRADILAAYMAAGLNLSALAPKASPALTGTPTAPTAAAGTNTTQIATTAFVQLSSPASLAANGYQKLPSGLIIQWGTTSVTMPATNILYSKVVAFPIAFPGGCLTANSTPSNIHVTFLNTSSEQLTDSGFTLLSSTGTGSYSAMAVRWLAIGY